MASPNRHPFVMLGAAASVITVLGFFGIQGWSSQHQETSEDRVSKPTDYDTHRPPPPCVCPSPTPTPVTCTFEDLLGDGQASETVRLTIDGGPFTLSVSRSEPIDRIQVRFKKAGRHDYAVAASTTNIDGSRQHGQGRGTFSCQGGETFTLLGDYSTDPAELILERA